MTTYGLAGNGDTTQHAYPASALAVDYLRAAAGLAPAALLFATVPIGTVAAVVLGGFAALFAAFGLRTAARHCTRLELGPAELQAQGVRRCTLRWAELDRMTLAYYSTRRDRKIGWMDLELRAGATRVSLDSRIAGFERLVWCAAEAAAQRGIALSDATVANLQALGIRLPEHGAD